MAVVINGSAARIAVAASGAKPDVAIRAKTVLFHLTQGFDGTAIIGDAFTFTGHVPLTGATSAASLAGFEFGFIQIMRANFTGVFYAGRMSREGSVGIKVDDPPALPNRTTLDSGPAPTPFTRVPGAARFTFVSNEAKCVTGDHPAMFIPFEFRNSTTNTQNFLFHVVDDREFWTVLTSIDPKGKTQHLQHIHWQLRHDVKFTWHAGRPVVAVQKSTFKIIGNLKGTPADPDAQAVLNAPAPPFSNDSSSKAMLQGNLGPRGPNRSENPQWFNNVPPSFFQ